MHFGNSWLSEVLFEFYSPPPTYYCPSSTRKKATNQQQQNETVSKLKGFTQNFYLSIIVIGTMVITHPQ